MVARTVSPGSAKGTKTRWSSNWAMPSPLWPRLEIWRVCVMRVRGLLSRDLRHHQASCKADFDAGAPERGSGGYFVAIELTMLAIGPHIIGQDLVHAGRGDAEGGKGALIGNGSLGDDIVLAEQGDLICGDQRLE